MMPVRIHRTQTGYRDVNRASHYTKYLDLTK